MPYFQGLCGLLFVVINDIHLHIYHNSIFMYLSFTMMDNILSLMTCLTWEVNIKPKIKQPLSYNIYISTCTAIKQEKVYISVLM